MGLLFARKGKAAGGADLKTLGAHQELEFGCVQFETPIDSQTVMTEQAAGFLSLEFQREL